MGTSQAASAPTTKDWKKHVPSALISPVHNPKTISDAVFSSTLPLLLPSGHVTLPLLAISNETIRFFRDCNTEGLEKTLQKLEIKISSTYVGPNLAKELWNNVQPKIDPKIVNSPFGMLAERAFRKTISSIIANGSHALGDDS